MAPGDTRAPRLSHLLRPRRPHSVFVLSADASRGHSFSSLLQKVPLDVGTALPAISSHIVCSTITHHPSPTIAGGALASTARVLGQVSLPYGTAPLAKPTAAHKDASDSLHPGSPHSSLNAIRESFLKSGLPVGNLSLVFLFTCEALQTALASKLVPTVPVPLPCFLPSVSSCLSALLLGSLGVYGNPPLPSPADIQTGQGAGALSSSLITESQSKPSIRKHVGP